MELPFSHEAFLDVFGAYNTALWPVVGLLWLATAGAASAWIARGRLGGRFLFAFLAVHWAWSGAVYHWLYFRAINPAASFFGAAFVVQAGIFAWLAAGSPRDVGVTSRWRAIVGDALVCCGLMYPFLGLAFGLHYPRLPLFAVPCPTTLLTAGWLLSISGIPRLVKIVPLLWAIVGSSAALALGIRADLALMPAGILLALDIASPALLGSAPRA